MSAGTGWCSCGGTFPGASSSTSPRPEERSRCSSRASRSRRRSLRPRQPPDPRLGGHRRNERAQLYLTDPEPGAAFEPLVVEPEFLHVSPRLSADGGWLAYSCNRRNGRDLDVFVRSLATGAERCVFSPGSFCEVAGFSPDGRWLGVLRLTERTGDNDLHLVDLEGDGPFLVAPDERDAFFGEPAWGATRPRFSSRPTRAETSPGSRATTSRAEPGSTCWRTTGTSTASPTRRAARSSCTRTSTATRDSISTTRGR